MNRISFDDNEKISSWMDSDTYEQEQWCEHAEAEQKDGTKHDLNAF